MTTDDVVDLLSAITAYDNRNASPANVIAWAKAAELGRWTLPEALDAVHAHFSECTDFLMPAHITARVKAARQDRALRAQNAELTAAPTDPAAAGRIARIITQLAAHMGWTDAGVERAGFALKVRCPHCHAPEGARCATPAGKPLTRNACHPSRAEVLAAQLRGAS
jgi:hypothetical protein